MKLIPAVFLMLLTPQLLRAQPISLSTPTGTLYGTLEMPIAPQPCPLALIFAGSGPTNRDGDSFALGGENDSLHLLAEGLKVQGIASVRYDKRGIAASAQAGAKEESLRFEHYINDAVLWINKLRRDRRFSTLVLIGHSEGSLIGMIAAQRAGADAFVSIAGPGRTAGDVLREQLKPKLPPDLVTRSTELIETLEQGKTTDDVPAPLAALFRPTVQPYLVSWFRYDPAQEIAKLRVPVLLVQGTTDLQVKVQDAQLLAKAKPSAKLVILSGMNHVLKAASGNMEQQMQSYIDPAFPLAPKLVSSIGQFIKSVPKRPQQTPVRR
ncbi:MAG TPA: alpha/beta fold hydrolase [Abditibacteriaceae bacterium]|jgi:hypothetical protein